MYDIIIIGAGIGGLIAASKLVSYGKKILILERNSFLGGSSSIFKRGDFVFPMGPLSFSYPNLVKKILKEVGIEDEIEFTRSHFQYYSPELDIIYSQDWNHFKNKLKEKFPEEIEGIEGFFFEFGVVLEAIKDVIYWNPDFIIGKKREDALKNIEDN
ncbi:MAG: NAD(P)-binding protein, partial [Candidatus Lokiarchaeota archaeon]|nr:NAD(P)-binding protein [Candidatus Lokiarchaeota archaeon]